MEPSGEVTELLSAIRNGDREAEARLITVIYPQLRQIAQKYMRRERSDHTLQPTALVHEAYLRLASQEREWSDRAHFYAAAAQVMRQILIDYARRHRAAKRGGTLQKLELDGIAVPVYLPAEKLLSLDEALSRLAQWDPRQSRIVEMRFFAGMTEEEISDAIGVSVRTVKRDWRLARAWLYSEIGK